MSSETCEREVWIGSATAARMIPSPRPGKNTHISTVIRLIKAGRLKGRQRGRWWFVRLADVLALIGSPQPAGKRQRTRFVKTVLERNGLI